MLNYPKLRDSMTDRNKQMKGLVSVLFLWISSAGFSQYIHSEEIDARGITKVELQLDAVSKVFLNTHKENYILLHSISEGEYQEFIFLPHEVIDGVFYVSSSFDDKLADGFDKLSAMKVFSVEIEIFIPEDLSVFISSSTASLEVLGQYYELNVALKSGSVLLNNYEGNAHVHTYNGNIDISTVDAKVNATSRNGTIHVVDFYVKRYFIEITSINGNIKVTSSEH